MSGAGQRVVIGERANELGEPDKWVWHLLTAPYVPEIDFVPVVCGGGVVYPSYPEARPRSEVCPDCLAGRVTLAST